MNSIAAYLLSLSACVLGYFAYLKFAVPLIEVPTPRLAIGRSAELVELTKPIDKTPLISLLPEDAWELSKCKTLVTSAGTILFKDLEPQDDGSVLFSPFTLIAGVGEETLLHQKVPVDQKAPTVIRSLIGATLDFTKPFQEAIQSGAKMSQARLMGEVDIYRPPTKADGSDVLHILTRNVQIDRHRIYTLDQVLFSYGPHQGAGRNLLIDLVHDATTAAGSQDFSSIQDASRLELAYLDRLRIVPSKKNKLAVKDDSPDDNSPAKLFTNDNSPIEVACKGPCVFEFDNQSVSFSDQVVATKIDEHRDNIQCDQLKLFFDGNGEHTEATAGSSTDKNEKLQLRRFVATGHPAIVAANSQPAKFWADRLTYDTANNQVEAFAAPAAAGDYLSKNQAKEHFVRFVGQEFQLTTQHLQYTFGEVKSSGSFVSNGPGQLIKLADPAKESDQPLIVTWKRQLTSRLDPRHPNLQLLMIDGQTDVQMSDEFQITSDRIDLTLRRNKKPNGKVELSPISMTAIRNVKLRSPEANGSTNKLTATWPAAEQLAGLAAYRASRVAYPQQQPESFNRLSPASTNPRSSLDSIAMPMISQNSAAGSSLFAKPSPQSTKKLIFSGDEVTTKLQSVGKKTELLDLTIAGHVNVVQQETNSDSSLGRITMTGEHLRVIPQQGPDQYRVALNSAATPSRIKTDDFVLTGDQIHLDQAANKVWVEGAGKLNLSNIAADQAKQDGRPNFGQPDFGQLDSDTSSFQAQWAGGMIFDGKRIYFEKNVGVANKQTEKQKTTITEAACGQMTVELDRFVDFKDSTKRNSAKNPIAGTTNELPKAKPIELIFIERVSPSKRVFAVDDPSSPTFANTAPMVIMHRTYRSDGKLEQQQSISAEQVKIDAVSKKIAADGPGWVSTHSRQSAKSSGAGQGTKSNPLARFSNSNKGDISFIRVNFDGDMQIDSQTGHMDINGRVRTAYLPLQDWRGGVDPDKIPAGQTDAVLLISQQLKIAQWKPRGQTDPVREVIATGNVRMTGDSIDLNSDRISYNEGNDLLVINGTPRTEARLRFREQPKPGSRAARGWQEITAEKIMYQVATQSFDVVGVGKSKVIQLN
jgi:lipopolysaccharide export system protein LptA